jgi:hypothetical protein
MRCPIERTNSWLSNYDRTPLDADLVAGLKRLKLAKVRAIAPEVLQTAKTQRWKPEEVLRTLIDAEIAARDESNARARLRAWCQRVLDLAAYRSNRCSIR